LGLEEEEKDSIQMSVGNGCCNGASDIKQGNTLNLGKIATAQEQYQVQADRKRLPAPEFPIGSWTFVKAKYFHTTCPSKKLSPKNEGPFEVITKIGAQSYTLCLPENMCPIFHVSMLEPAQLNTIPGCVVLLPPPIEIEGDLDYEISEILDSKLDHCCKACQLQYLVHWTGYEGTDEEKSWILATEVEADELLETFHTAYPHKLGPLSTL